MLKFQKSSSRKREKQVIQKQLRSNLNKSQITKGNNIKTGKNMERINKILIIRILERGIEEEKNQITKVKIIVLMILTIKGNIK